MVDYFSDVYVCVGIMYMSRFSEEVSLASSIHACMVEYSENPKPILTNEGHRFVFTIGWFLDLNIFIKNVMAAVTFA